jgi:hypothetical protein
MLAIRNGHTHPHEEGIDRPLFLPQDDKRVYKMLSEADTWGCFRSRASADGVMPQRAGGVLRHRR